jgi:hypothetical protein
MPSDSPLVGLGGARPAAPTPDRWGWLRSQGLGLVCGFGTVLLLAVGSVVMVVTREGASAGIGLDDLTAFFERPSAAHLWLYLLFPLAGLYALNTTLATIDNVRRRWRAGQRAPAAYAIAVVHAGFLLALVAHGVGGFRSEERGGAVITSGWQPLPGFGEVRLASLDVDTRPGGMPKAVRAVVERRGPDGGLERATVGYNQPLSSGWGARLALLQEFGRAPVARLSSGQAGCTLAEGQRCLLGGEPVELVRLGGAPGPGGAALLRASGPGGAVEDRWVASGALLPLRGGRPLSLDAVDEEPAVLLRVRETPGVPWALLSAVALAAGTALMWRRLVPRSPRGLEP